MNYQSISTVVDLLRHRALQQPEHIAFTFLQDGETESAKLSFAALDKRARAIAAQLQTVCTIGARALLLYPPGLEFIAAFCGCLNAGVVAVPAYPPRRNRPDPRIQAIAADAQATVLLTTTELLADMEQRAAHTPELKDLHLLATDGIADGLADAWEAPHIDSDTLAFLQYTSGSTGTPKGVMVSHGNLLHNQRLIETAFQHSEQTVFVSWLPVYHDMGLIGNVLHPLYLGVPCTLMAPVAFLQKPVRWLQAISRYKGTTSGGPNFAYQLCIEKTTPEQRASLDLSSWDIAFNGAEPIRPETLEQFTEAFQSCGFHREAFYPCYGMAETTLFVTGKTKTKLPTVHSFQEKGLEQGQALLANAEESGRALAGSGRIWLDEQLVIVDPQALTPCSDGRVGEIWVAGPSVGQGYWNRPEATQQTFQARLADTDEVPFLRTGDLGFLREGELFVTGRRKDLIIIRGRNHYPHDIEMSVERCHPALRPGCGAAFSVQIRGEERLVVVQEIEPSHLRQLNAEEIIAGIRQAVSERHELQLEAVLLLKPASIPKTSSGKIQRHACRNRFLENTLTVVGEWRRAEEKASITPLRKTSQQANARNIEDWLLSDIAQRLQIDAKRIDVCQPFARYGLDSAAAVGMSGALGEWLGCELSPTLVYDYPCIEALARYLAEQNENDSAKASADSESDDIAVIGIGCRFPGAEDPESFWRLLRDGVDAVSEVPTSRWNADAFYDPTAATPGKMNTRWGGFLDQVDQFDPQFFGISSREAETMDPQQRLLLEVSWEALEHAGQAPTRLAQSQTGVFIGISNNDYGRLQFSQATELNAFAGTGNALGISANRLSYLLDLRGPSCAVDTACSSSLVAVHQASESLRRGECDLALAGGVNLILSPEVTIALSQAHMMAADGRCKTFDADANGYVRGEGCGIVVLKRLTEARRDGDAILALIKGSAINQDGRSNGLTAPNGPAQQAVIRQALQNASVAPEQIGYVETHGTGTALGDPIELNALREVLTPGRSVEHSCRVGSVKTNIGHLESAAGIAALIKTVLSLHHGEIPPHLHLQTLNPHISLADGRLDIPVQAQPWPASNERRLAGVSSFGFGGTNAHVILEQAPSAEPPAASVERPAHLLTLSARDESALQALAATYGTWLQTHPQAALADVCFSANTGRAHFEHRLVVSAESATQLQERLDAFVNAEPSAGLLSGESPETGKPVFMFTGQGCQYPGMGRTLYQTQPVFRDALDRCDYILRPYRMEPLLNILYPPSGADSRLNETAYTQPALFALEYALAELWCSWGVQPAAVLGHSLGEYVAACVAGVFTLEEGLKLVAERARLMQSLPGDGAMVMVHADETRVTQAVQAYAEEVAVAAINGPDNTVISGRREALEMVVAALERDGIKTNTLPVSHAFHSPFLEPMLDEFQAVARQIRLQPPRIPLISNLTGNTLPPEQLLDADYWRRQTREAVRFMAGVDSLLEQGHELFLELGPHPVLSTLGRGCDQSSAAHWLPSLTRGRDDWQVLLGSLSRLYLQGVDIDWDGFEQGYPRQRLSLPTYPFQRKRCWLSQGDDATMPTTNPMQLTAQPETPQRERILAKLQAIVAGLLEVAASEVDVHTPFLEMGADSILLMDAVQTIEKTFQFKIGIRRLFEELTTLDALAAYIDQQLPADSEWAAAPEHQRLQETPVVPTTPPPSEALSDATVSETALERIMQQQLQIMAEQLEVLKGRGLVSKRPLTAPSTLPELAVQKVPVAVTSPQNWGATETRAHGVNPQQQCYLEAFISRYTARSAGSKQLAQHYRPVLADNRASVGFRFSTKEMLYPIVSDRSEGARIWDVDANEYIDISMGFGVNLFGHNPDFVIEALQAQLQQGMAIGPQNRLAGEVAQLIRELTGLERICFVNSGTEAVMTALRLARTSTGRRKIALFSGSYHGHYDGTLGIAQSDDPAATPMAPGVTPHMVADTVVLNYGDPSALEILREQAQELAAVLVEPVQSRRPNLQPREFLQELRTLTQETGIALIFDEMITGFRIHPGGAQAWFGVEADIATYGKIVGGGMPIGVVAGKAAYMDSLDGGQWNFGDASYPQAETTFFAGTFCKHPLAMAASRAVLQQIKKEGPALQERLNRDTERLATTLNAYFEAEEVPVKIVHFGSLFRFRFTSNLDLLFYHLLAKGIYIWEGRNCFLSAAHSEDDIERVIQAVKDSVDELRAGGFLPERTRQPAQKQILQMPLSEAQKQLWTLTRLGDEGSLAYNLSLSLRLQGPFDLTAMRQAVQTLIERHEALRTTIAEQGEVQYVLPSLEIDVPLLDFSVVKGSARESAVGQWFEQQSHQSFVLEQGPLFRVHVLKLEAQQHILVLTAHHIVTDGWSLGVMVQELGALYTAECRGSVCQLEPAMPFRDYLQWQAQESRSEDMAQHEAYWRAQFADSIPVLALPSDRSQPPLKSYRGRRQSIQLAPSLGCDLKRLAKQQGCTLFMTLLSAYTILLHRLADQDDIVVGIPSGGRSLEGSEHMVGYCAHLLPIRSRVIGSPTFIEYLAWFKRELLSAYQHQDYPFARLIERLGITSDSGRSPLVSAIFNLERPQEIPELADLGVELFSQPIAFAAFDLSVNAIVIDDALRLDCDYDSDLFDAATIKRVLAHFQVLLESIVTDPHHLIAELPLLNQTERRRVLQDWSVNPRAYPQSSMHQLFEAQAERNPQSVALVFGEQKLSYRELNHRANQLAHYLRTQGVGPETLVGLCVQRSPEMVIGVLGILKAGGAYLPLDPNYPQERLSFMLADSEVKLVLSQAGLVLPETAAQRLDLDHAWPLIAQARTDNPASGVSPEQLAYVIYTSGSTGRPKGVLLTHRGLSNLAQAQIDAFQVCPDSRVLQFASFSFDASVSEIAMALCAGARLYLAPSAELLPGEALLSYLRNQAISHVTLPPSALAVMPEHELPALETLAVAGEACPAELVTRWAPGRRFINAYGPTEVTVCASLAECGADDGIPSIGRPLANTELYVLDRHLQPLPVGVPGELYIGGVGLARGYLKRPELSAERFIRHPFSSDPQARLYKTGDRVRYRPDGQLEYLGRSDHQVKIRGFRIEPGEIEAALGRHPALRQCVVSLREDRPGDKRLVAYLVTEQALSAAELRAFLKTRLPEHMIPAAFVMLERLPLTPNGKIDRKALPAPDRSTLEHDCVAPNTPTEELLAGLWADTLNLTQVGIHDNFFELGGDSILSIQIASRAVQAGLQLSPRQLFQHQTIAELATAVGKAPEVQAEQGIVSGPVPLTPIQHWLFEQSLPEPQHFNQSVLLKLPSVLQPALLKRALQHLVLHHDALRLRFVLENSDWQQENAGSGEAVPFTVVDLSAQPAETRQAALENTAGALHRGLKLDSGPLLQAALFQLGDQQRLLIVIHHLAVDGVSWRILLEDLQTVYRQLEGGETINLPPKTSAFKHWAERLNEYAQTVAAEREYWLDQAQVSALPTDFPLEPDANTAGAAARMSVALNAEQTRQLLQDVPQAYNTQINDALLSALQQTFARWTGESSLLIDLEGHGREPLFEEIDLSRTVGWFTTVFPVCVEASDDDPGTVLKTIKEQLRRIPQHGIGYGMLRYLSQDAETRAALQALPQPQVNFNYLGQLDQNLADPALLQPTQECSGPQQSPLNPRRHLLEVEALVSEGCLQMSWIYCPQVHRQSTVEGLAQGFIAALEALIAHCRSPEIGGYTPSDFPEIELSQEDLDELVAELSN